MDFLQKNENFPIVYMASWEVIIQQILVLLLLFPINYIKGDD